jgi:hypothetical protein
VLARTGEPGERVVALRVGEECARQPGIRRVRDGREAARVEPQRAALGGDVLRRGATAWARDREGETRED